MCRQNRSLEPIKLFLFLSSVHAAIDMFGLTGEDRNIGFAAFDFRLTVGFDKIPRMLYQGVMHLMTTPFSKKAAFEACIRRKFYDEY